MLLVFCSFSFHGQVTDVDGEDVVCQIKNSAILARQLYTLHVSQIRIDLPTLTDKDKEVSYYLGVRYLVFTKWWTWGPNQFHPPVNSGNWCCSYHLTVAMENLFLNTKFSRFLSCNFHVLTASTFEVIELVHFLLPFIIDCDYTPFLCGISMSFQFNNSFLCFR